MLYTDQLRRCVLFLCSSRDHFVGTAFLVGVTSQKMQGISYGYLVTAKHIVEKSLTNKPFFVRMNDRAGSCKLLRVEAANWYYHPSDNTADVAVLPFGFDDVVFDYKMVPLEMFVSDDTIHKEIIGTGSEVLIAGLFAFSTGSQRNQPIVRMGNVAMIPNEPIPTWWGNIEAYLIEARSIGGVSGSPVFVSSKSEGKTYLLGVMRGHWKIRPETLNDVYPLSDDRGVNLGIAVVSPAKKILETLNRPELVEQRKKADSV